MVVREKNSKIRQMDQSPYGPNKEKEKGGY